MLTAYCQRFSDMGEANSNMGTAETKKMKDEQKKWWEFLRKIFHDHGSGRIAKLHILVFRTCPLCRLLMFQFNPILYVSVRFETKISSHLKVINILAYSQILYLLFRDRRACVSL